jgi:hypothetical protein
MRIKCWNLGLNAWGLKRFMVVLDITTTLIGWAQLGPKKIDRMKFKFSQIWC